MFDIAERIRQIFREEPEPRTLTIKPDPLVVHHRVKITPEFFDRVLEGRKPYEVRKDDRNYQVGENIQLMEWNERKKKYTGDWIIVEITDKLEGGRFGIEPGYCALGVKYRDDNCSRAGYFGGRFRERKK